MIDLTVKTLDSQNHSFSLDDDITVRGFKEYIAESVVVPADCQRLIYCGRVLQDEKKLNDYDVNGKVIHLVQRAPPQPGQRGNSGGQSQNNSQNTDRTHRTHYRIVQDTQNGHAGPNPQVHGNAMYLGAMTLPTEVVEGHGLPVPQLSNTLSNSRIVMAKRMLTNANRIMDRLDNPNSAASENSGTERRQSSSPLESTDPMDTSRSETSQGESAGPAFMSQDEAIEVESGLFQSFRTPQRDWCTSNRETIRMENALRVAVADVLSTFRFQNAISSSAEDDTEIHEVEVSTSNDTQPETTSQSQQPRESSSNEEPRSSERPRTTALPRPPQMAELLEMLMATQDRLRPYLERYRALMATDPVLSPTGTGPESVAENQHIVDEVSRILHFISHAEHALSDIIVDMEQAPPRNLSCRPIIIQQSAILQAGIPIQLEAHISLHGRNAHNNSNSTEENSSAPTAPSVPEAVAGAEARETLAEERPQQQNSPSINQQQQQSPRSDQQTSDQQQRPNQQQQQSQTPFGSMFNLPANVEVLMEVSPDSSMDLSGADDQSPNNGANNNNNAEGSMRRGASRIFPWGAAPPSDFIRNLMHAVAGHIVQDPVGMTSNQASNGATVTISQQTIGVTIDSNGQNSGQSTQARNNVGTHPTTSTQTRSTSRPHVFHSHGVGLGQGLSSDPFLPCNSHHLRRIPTAGANASRQSATSRNQAEPQSSASSSATNSTSNTSPTPWIIDGDSYLDDLRDVLGNRRFKRYRGRLAHSLRNLVRTLSKGKVDVRFSGDVPATASSITLAELLENREEGGNSLSTHAFGCEGNFLVDLFVLFAQNVTLEGFVGLRFTHYDAISNLRRPLRDLIQQSFPQAAPTTELQESFINGLLSCLRPHLENILPGAKDTSNRSIARVDVVRTIEGLFRRHFTNLLKRVFNDDLDDVAFEQETIAILNNLGTETCNVLRHLVVGGEVGFREIILRFVTDVAEDVYPFLRRWAINKFITQFPIFCTQVTQLPNSEIIPLLVFETPTRPVVTEIAESSDSDQEATPTVFPGQEMLPPDWVPVIARDGARQRRLAQGISSGDVPTFSDAYLGCLPCKRRKIIQQEKPQILVNPTSSHSTITASIERLVRESVSRTGVAEVEGASVAVANDLGVGSAFGHAIRDCLQPQRYRTPDFPDPSRFPNATKFFQQDRPPNQ